MNIEEFENHWNAMSDDLRIKFLVKHKSNLKLPKYKINVDNDSVFLTFIDEEDFEYPTILDFDSFGYELLNTIFNSIGIESDFV